MVKRLTDSWFLLVYLLTAPALVPVPVWAQGHSAYDLQWNTASGPFTYIFSGHVSFNGKPCPAQVRLQFTASGMDPITQVTTSNTDGTYNLIVVLPSAPVQPAEWKLIAQAPQPGMAHDAEVEGQAIVAEDETTVNVDRPIQLIHS